MTIKEVDINSSDLLIKELPSIKNKKIAMGTVPWKTSKVMKHRQFRYEANGYHVPEYNLYEIAAAEDADGIIKRSIQKKRALFSKEGYSFTGKNNRTVEYLKTRLKQIELAQGKKMELLIKNTGGDLLRNNNAYWLKVRNSQLSDGKKREVLGVRGQSTIDPVVAYFQIPAETVRFKTDKNDRIIKYMQLMPDGRHKEYDVKNVIHYKHNSRPGLHMAPPSILPAIDDIKSLRRIEENVELLVEQHLFPLFTLSIGTDEWPAGIDDTTGLPEVDVWTTKLQEMPPSGGLVVPHRLRFDLLKNDKIIQVEKYLEHFKKRAYTSAGVSNIDMGEGDGMNRSTADNASQILIDDVKDYQQDFKYQFEFEVVYELLLEYYDVNVLNDEHIVEFEFKEIDVESQIKRENHNWLGYQMNGITEDEMRTRNRQQIIDDEKTRSKMHLHLVEEEQIRMNAKYAIKETGTSSKTNKEATNKEKPTNQHGSKSGPTGRKSSLERAEWQIDQFLRHLNMKDSDLAKIEVVNLLFSFDLIKNQDNIDVLFLDKVDNFVDSAVEFCNDGTLTVSQARELLSHQITSLIKEN